MNENETTICGNPQQLILEIKEFILTKPKEDGFVLAERDLHINEWEMIIKALDKL